jgi:hypothetical protein
MYNIDDSEIDRRLQANNKWNQSFKCFSSVSAEKLIHFIKHLKSVNIGKSEAIIWPLQE